MSIMLNNGHDIKTSIYISHKLDKSLTSSGLILQRHLSRTLTYKNSYFNLARGTLYQNLQDRNLITQQA